MKECTHCEKIKPLTAFNRDKSNKDGRQYRCRECVNRIMRKKRAGIKVIKKVNCVICETRFIRKGSHRTCSKECSEINTKQKLVEGHAKRMQDPEYREAWRLKSIMNRKLKQTPYLCKECNNLFINKFGGNRFSFCSKWCLAEYKAKEHQLTPNRIRNRLCRGIRRCATKGIISKWTWEILDFTFEEFKEKFQSQFYPNPETGEEMNWSNMGEWHIDHIMPKSKFTPEGLSDPSSAEFKTCWCLGNLRPLWAKDNLRKGNKIPGVDYI